MCQVEHENMAKFIGLCLNGPFVMSIWRFYHRGSIQVLKILILLIAKKQFFRTL